MPITPFHLGPALLLGILFGLNIPAVLVGSVILDLEALYLLLGGAGYLHGFFHSYIGASIVSVALGFAFGKYFPNIFPGLLAGAYSHVFLDSFLYPDVRPFWPMAANPFLGMASSYTVYTSATFALVAGILFYAFLKIKKRPRP